MPNAEPNFGVYVHWPFCLSKCPYCDFNSHVRHTQIDEARFVRAFETEIAATAVRTGARTVSTVFFGGGTPSLMQPSTVGIGMPASVPGIVGIVVGPAAANWMESSVPAGRLVITTVPLSKGTLGNSRGAEPVARMSARAPMTSVPSETRT